MIRRRWYVIFGDRNNLCWWVARYWRERSAVGEATMRTERYRSPDGYGHFYASHAREWKDRKPRRRPRNDRHDSIG